MASISPSLFSLRPWPTGDKKPKTLGEFIGRINAERGGFRHVDESQLRQEIRVKEADLDDGSNGARGQESESDEEEEEEVPKTIITQRDEFLKHADIAHQSAMLALDDVSLYLSKETPNQANTTLSPALRELVGFGVLGSSKVHDSNVTPERAQDEYAVGTGWRLQGIAKVAETALSDAEVLEKEIGLEGKYWGDIFDTSEKGWDVAPLPNEPHTLGARIGFSEAASEYRDSSLAALRRNDDGSVRLDSGRLGSGSQRICATIQKNGQVTGISRLASPTSQTASLSDRVLEARNTIFAQELWYEINREARTLLSLDVRSEKVGTTYDLSPDTKITISLEDTEDPPEYQDLPDNDLAEATTLGLLMLLTSAHQQNYFRRTRGPQPTTSRTSPRSIIRPLISRLKFDNACGALSRFLIDLTAILKLAGLTGAQSRQVMQPANAQLNPMQLSQLGMQSTYHPGRSESLAANLVYTLETSAEISITPEARILVRGRSFVHPLVVTQFIVTLSKAPTNGAPPQESQDAVLNPLEYSFPPNNEPYPNVDEVIHYIRNASVRAIVESVADMAAEKLGRDDIGWAETMHGAVVGDRDEREARISISDSEVPELSLHVQWLDGRHIRSRQFTWGVTSTQRESLEEVLLKFFRGETSP